MFNFIPSSKEAHATNFTLVRSTLLMHCSNVGSEAVFAKSDIFAQIALIFDVLQVGTSQMNLKPASIAASEVTVVALKISTIFMDAFGVGEQQIFPGEHLGAMFTYKLFRFLMQLLDMGSFGVPETQTWKLRTLIKAFGFT